MKIKILAFGIAREICGGRAFELEVPDQFDTASLQSMLGEKFPRLLQLATCQLALNEEYVWQNSLIAPGDEVAILPPVSGG